jgi:hypothetical protein
MKTSAQFTSFAAVITNVMLLGHPLIVRCPACGQEHRQTNLLSGNTFGGMFWSDGSSFAPMMPDTPYFSVCSTCGHFFCVKRCEQFESDDESVYELPSLEHPGRNALSDALSRKLFEGKNEEIYLRTRFWWSMNKRPFQQEDTTGAEDDKAYRLNALALLELLNDADQHDLLIMAELHRNLKDFGKCLELLNRITEKRLEERRQQIEKACKSKISSTIRIEFNRL